MVGEAPGPAGECWKVDGSGVVRERNEPPSPLSPHIIWAELLGRFRFEVGQGGAALRRGGGVRQRRRSLATAFSLTGNGEPPGPEAVYR